MEIVRIAHHLVVGAGGIGRATARHLTAVGHEVTLASRSGTDPQLPGVRPLHLDATDADALTEAARGVASIVNAVNPSRYYTWERDWPPVAAALLAAAEATGAGLVTVGNLYAYGPVDGAMTEDTPLHPAGNKGRVREQMWRDALAAQTAGRARVTELRASDYFGPDAGAGVSMCNTYIVTPAAAGRTVRLVTGLPDVPHSWTYLDDIGTLAATLATDDRSWGQVWHVPTGTPRTARQVARDAAAAAGRPEPRVTTLPRIMKHLARVNPTARELDETAHQFEHPFVLDATLTGTTFGLAPTPWTAAIEATVRHLTG